MISPFEALTGNLSGSQNLKYPTRDNSAWDAPDNKRSYATNYVPRYVGVQRSDGTTFFSVKKRTAIKNSPAQKRAQAVLAATKLYIDAIDRDETMSVRLGPVVALLATTSFPSDTLMPDDGSTIEYPLCLLAASSNSPDSHTAVGAGPS